MSISILLADDHQIMRDGLKALIVKEDEFEIIGEAADGDEALKKVIELRPDIVVMDLNMPAMSGIEATRRIVEINPDTKVIALSMLHDRVCVLECLKAGAKGYLVKNCAAEELIIAIRALAAGGTYLCNKVAGLVIPGAMENEHNSAEALHSLKELSRRELDVLKLIAEGMSTKEIAFAFNVSVKTIDVERFNIMKKLDLRSIAALTKYAVRVGLTSGE
jgi:DNA-binding NarL/FixJ family response regulator